MKFRGRGGVREGAGRPKVLPGKRRVPHRARARLKARFPVHVNTRVRRDVPRLRNRKMCAVIRNAMWAVMDEAGFRICQFSVQGNHLHLVCEADDNAALSRGMKRFKQRVARGINRLLGRTGSVFLDRYHMEIATTPRHVRAVLCYVLQNARRHGLSIPAYAGGVDPYSSARWFDGWKTDDWRAGLPPPDNPKCVSHPETWLLRTGWQKAGLIGVTEVPAAGR